MNAAPSGGLAGGGPEAVPHGGTAPAPAGLPGQRRNNCISPIKPGYKFKAMGERLAEF